MKTKDIARIARAVFDEHDEKSAEWCLTMIADECGCDHGDVVGAMTAHPDISGIEEVK